MSEHALLSPSAAPRYSRCFGSVREEAKYPDTSGPAAIDGTHTHTLLETTLNSDAMAADFVGQTLTDHEGSFVVDKERAERVALTLRYIDQRISELSQNNGEDVLLISEKRVDPEYLVGRKDMSGTVDVQIHATGARVLEIIDYKDGMNEVPIDTEQLELYALGVLAGFKTPINLRYPFDTVRLTIIQPKLALKGINPIRYRELPVRDVLDLAGKYAAIGKRIDDPDAPLIPGEIQCKYCKAKGNCKALTTSVMEKVNVMFSPVSVAQQSANKDPAEMSDDELKEILEAAPLLRQLLEAADREALRRLESGRSLPGYKLVHGRGNRDWAFPDDEMAEKLIKMGIPKGSVYLTKLVSPAQAEKLTWEKRDGEKKQLTDRQLKLMESEYIVKKQGKLTVVPESDNRPAVTVNAQSLFAPVNEIPDWLK